eukprot:CAMPEP_0177632650 /NCGR_PEP_ID=MMETSP0447-20121125/2415_1 /TAXON_ID=0 /ORGANISM="Stygamoeba regulata, Strain BSH-02190019" /LENGTH=582 /DNA_ID=CAMNT_0019134253 /DNA_START=67 /DNA_END=1816 /DNA_ORIENTATION=-
MAADTPITVLTDTLSKLEGDAPHTPEERLASFNALEQLLQTNNTDKAFLRLLSEKLGLILRDEHNRTACSQSGLPAAFSRCFEVFEEADDLQFGARAIGNMCYENEASSKAIVEGSKALERMVHVLSMELAPTILRTITGALANMAAEYAPSQQRISDAGGLAKMVALLESSNGDVLELVTRTLINLAEEEDRSGKSYGDVVASLSDMALDSAAPKKQRENALTCLVGIAAVAGKAVAKRLANANAIQRLADLSFPTACDAEDLPLMRASCHMLAALADHEKASFWSLLPTIMDGATTHSDAPMQRFSLKILAHLSVDDSLMTSLFVSWKKFHSVLVAKRADLETAVMAVMLLSNLGRKDEHVKEMAAQDGIFELLLDMINSNDARLQHLSLGFLRNLAIPASLKEKAAFTPNAIPTVISRLESSNAVVSFAAVGAIKTFLTGPETIADAIIKEGGLDAIIRLSEGAQEGLERIMYESCRILVVLAKHEKYREIRTRADGSFASKLAENADFAKALARGLEANVTVKAGHDFMLAALAMLRTLAEKATLPDAVKAQVTQCSTSAAAAEDVKNKAAEVLAACT